MTRWMGQRHWRRSAWTAALVVAGLTTVRAASTPLPSARAVECRERGGLPNLFAKLTAGRAVRIAYLGGSITEQEGWRPKSLAWFQARFPSAAISQINAAIGGTGSELGVFRLDHDVLAHQPDLLFVEFAVNDSGAPAEQIERCMEGIVRQTWRRAPATDVCFVYTLSADMLPTLEAGWFPRSAAVMEAVAEHYAIPSIHFGVEVARLAKAGQLLFKGPLPTTPAQRSADAGKVVFSPDGVHPYPATGHVLYVEALARSMLKMQGLGQPGPHRLPPPLRADNWEAAKMLPLSQAALSAGWRRLTPARDALARRFGNRLPELWEARHPGETIMFRFRGIAARVYDLMGPDAGRVFVAVDDQAPEARSRFDAYCTYYRLNSLPITANLPDAVHTVRLAIDPEPPDKARILAQRGERMDDPRRFAGTTWDAGALLIVGELVP